MPSLPENDESTTTTMTKPHLGRKKPLITPERSESGAADIRRGSRCGSVASNGGQKLDLKLRTDSLGIGAQSGEPNIFGMIFHAGNGGLFCA